MISVDGTYTLDAPRDQIWPHIFDPNSLMNLIPGCQGLIQISPDEYQGKIRIGFASISGEYDTLVIIKDRVPPGYCHFDGEISGPTGIAKGEAIFNLEEEHKEEKTIIHYQATALISGAIGQLNPRFIEGAINTLIHLGLSTLNRRVKAAPSGSLDNNHS